MEYVAITHDGQQYRFPESALPLVESAMANKTPVRIAGSVVSGSSISHVDRIGANRYGPENTSRLSLAAGEVFASDPAKEEYWKAKTRKMLEEREGDMARKKREYLEAAHNPEIVKAHREAAMERLRVTEGLEI